MIISENINKDKVFRHPKVEKFLVISFYDLEFLMSQGWATTNHKILDVDACILRFFSIYAKSKEIKCYWNRYDLYYYREGLFYQKGKSFLLFFRLKVFIFRLKRGTRNPPIPSLPPLGRHCPRDPRPPAPCSSWGRFPRLLHPFRAWQVPWRLLQVYLNNLPRYDD